MEILYLLIFTLALLFPSESANASQIHVQVSDPIYTYLDRCATQGLLPGFANNIRPLSRDYLAEQLLVLYSQKDIFCSRDVQILEEFMADYRMEIRQQDKHFQISEDELSFFFFSSKQNLKRGLHNIFEYAPHREKQHLFIYENDQESVWVDWDEMIRMESKNGITRPVTQDAIQFSAQLGNHFSVYFDGYRYLQFIKDGYTDFPQEYKGGYINDVDEGILFNAFDYSNAYVKIEGIYGSFSLGIEPIVWGNGPNSLVLSDNVPPFPFFKWQKNFKRASFSFFHGSLMPEEFDFDTTTSVKTYAQKYIVGHRWEMWLTKKLNFSFSEIYLYGNRNIDLAYLVPPVLLWPTQHNLMDRDNATMAFDTEYFPLPGLKLYGSLFLDELYTSKIFKTFWANKQGIQIGAHVAPLKLKIPADFRLELTAVHPWTYTHDYQYTTYTHHGIDLGFYAGPNSRLWFYENQWWFSHRLKASFQYRHLQHGDDVLDENDPNYYPVGGNSNQNYSERNKDLDKKTTWLMGDIKTTRGYGLLLSYRWRKEIVFDWGMTLRNFDGHQDNYMSFQIRFDY